MSNLNLNGKVDLTKVAINFEKDGSKAISSIYGDGFKSWLQAFGECGEFVKLIPLALSGWIYKNFAEYLGSNIGYTSVKINKKICNIPVEERIQPNERILLEALKNISIHADCENMREMFAGLIANSCDKNKEKDVMPSFITIIVQLTADEAKILQWMFNNNIDVIPSITIRRENSQGSGISVLEDYNFIAERAGCINCDKSRCYILNLVRLGILQKSALFSSLTDKKHYDDLKNSSEVIKILDDVKSSGDEFNIPRIIEEYFKFTEFGLKFCEVCVR